MNCDHTRLHRRTAIAAGIWYGINFAIAMAYMIKRPPSTKDTALPIYMMIFAAVLLASMAILFIGRKNIVGGIVFSVSTLGWASLALAAIFLCNGFIGFHPQTIFLIVGCIALVGVNLLMALDCFFAQRGLRWAKPLFLILPIVFYFCVGFFFTFSQEYFAAKLYTNDFGAVFSWFAYLFVILLLLAMAAIVIPVALAALSFYLSYRTPTATLSPKK